MDADHQPKLSSQQRLQNATDFLAQYQEVIMETATIPSDVWERLMNEGMLGPLKPTKVLAKAIIANIQKFEDNLLAETIWEYLKDGDGPKRCRAANVKEWFTILHDVSLEMRLEGPTQQGQCCRYGIYWRFATH